MPCSNLPTGGQQPHSRRGRRTASDWSRFASIGLTALATSPVTPVWHWAVFRRIIGRSRYRGWMWNSGPRRGQLLGSPSSWESWPVPRKGARHSPSRDRHNQRLKLTGAAIWFFELQRSCRRPRQLSRTFGRGGIQAVEALLAELEPLLYGYNYQVFLRAYRVPFAASEPAAWYVAQALGPAAVISGSVPVTGQEIVAEVERSLRFVGDEGSGPKPALLRSRRFKGLVPAVLSELARVIAEASLLAEFALREGHPAYPVFWDFAYVIAGPAGGLVFIGSSSD